jgi:hypothetical protein
MIIVMSLGYYILYMLILFLLKTICFILKYTFFLMPLLVIKGIPIMLKMMMFMAQIVVFIICLPFIAIKSLF